MARDCPDRQRGADWRNGPQGAMPSRPAAGRIGGGDAVDLQYEVSYCPILLQVQCVTDAFLATHARTFR